MTQTCGRASHVHSHITAADHQHPLAEVEVITTRLTLIRKSTARRYTVELFTLHIEIATMVGADADEHCIELVTQIGEREVAA